MGCNCFPLEVCLHVYIALHMMLVQSLYALKLHSVVQGAKKVFWILWATELYAFPMWRYVLVICAEGQSSLKTGQSVLFPLL